MKTAPHGFTVAFFPVWTLAADVTAPGVGPVVKPFTDDDLAAGSPRTSG